MVLSIPAITDDMATVTAAIHYRNAGWFVLPVRAGTKDPGSVVGKAWQTKSTQDVEQIVEWFQSTDHGIALHVGRSGVVAIDVDYPEKLPADVAALLDLAPVFQSTRDDQPGRGHYLFTQPAGRRIGNSLGDLGTGWGEIRGDVGVIVVAPSVHPAGGHYRWRGPAELTELPAELAARLPDRDDQPTAYLASGAVSAWLTALPVGQPCGVVVAALNSLCQAATRKLGDAHDNTNAALLNLLRMADRGHPGVAACLEPAQRLFVNTISDRSSAVEADGEWMRMLDGGIAKMAGEAADRHQSDPCVEHDFDYQVMRATFYPPSVAGGRFLPPGDGSVTGTNGISAVDLMLSEIMSEDDLYDLPDPEPFVEGLIDVGNFALIYGEPGSMKSFVAVDMLACAANGIKWHARNTTRTAALYVPAEGGRKQIGKRLRAWSIQHGMKSNVKVLPRPVDIFHGGEMDTLVEVVLSMGVGVVVFDTYNRCTPGLNENTAEDVGYVLPNVQKLTSQGVTVIIIHHTPRDGTNPRGSSALQGSTDHGLRVERPKVHGLSIQLINDRQKDHSEGETMTFKAELVAEADSLVITSNYVETTSEFNDIEMAVLEWIIYKGPLSEREIKRAAIGKGTATERKDALSILIERGYVETSGSIPALTGGKAKPAAVDRFQATEQGQQLARDVANASIVAC